MKPYIEPLFDWMEANKPPDWQDWEWHKFLCSLGRIYVISAAATFKIPIPELVRYLTVPLPGELDS